jgi:uncharacterized protein YecT (DUF1311 family)
MRRALVLATVAALVGASTAAALGPTVIHEPWTPLPCPAHPSSTIEIEGCLEKAIARSDRRIDKSASRIFGVLRQAPDRAAFVEGEREWLRYRRHSCKAEGSIYRGGSAEPIAFLTCEKRRNLQHIADLAAMERTLRRR